jgi:hypothetical protein
MKMHHLTYIQLILDKKKSRNKHMLSTLSQRATKIYSFFFSFYCPKIIINISIFRILAARRDSQYSCNFKKGPESSILSRIS